MLTPVELVKFTISTGEAKLQKPKKQVLISAIFSGIFIAIGALASLAATYGLFASNTLGLETYGLGKFFQGLLFASGLMFVIFLGTDLFTGNILIVMAWLNKKANFGEMFTNWTIVWIGNLLGAVLMGFLFYKSEIFGWSDSLFGGVLLKTAYAKSSLDFSTAFFSGVICNILVCLVVLASYVSKDGTTKLGVIILGIMIFVASGSEHIVANMGYYAGAFFSRENLDAIAMSGKSIEDIKHATEIGTILYKNFLPVTLGNIVGGAVVISAGYYYMVKDKLTGK